MKSTQLDWGWVEAAGDAKATLKLFPFLPIFLAFTDEKACGTRFLTKINNSFHFFSVYIFFPFYIKVYSLVPHSFSLTCRRICSKWHEEQKKKKKKIPRRLRWVSRGIIFSGAHAFTPTPSNPLAQRLRTIIFRENRDRGSYRFSVSFSRCNPYVTPPPFPMCLIAPFHPLSEKKEKKNRLRVSVGMLHPSVQPQSLAPCLRTSTPLYLPCSPLCPFSHSWVRTDT